MGSVVVDNDIVQVSDKVKDLGIILDSQLNMHHHVTSVCKSVYFNIRTREGVSRKNIVAVSFFQNCAIHSYS